MEPRVFVRATDNWGELSARFVVPVRARAVKDPMTRRVLDRFAEHSIEVASATQDITVHQARRQAPHAAGGWTTARRSPSSPPTNDTTG